MMDKTSQILIIDDDSRNLFALKTVLKSRQLQCFTALSFNDALEILANNPQIKIILLDMMMPNIDGYEALKIIKDNPKFNQIQVIAVTAQAMWGDKEKCLTAGADDYISKPIDISILMRLINN
jgi:two-component system cell cycle response regulator DivK